MAEKKPLLIRIDPKLWEELRRLADSELRSMNGQIEYLLAEAIRKRRSQDSSEEATR
ncbi:MAG: Arc family DNA binding domain-containing protein [Armatimonadetes bacterium]|nr:Arc family DNA binding domain-containing protein [Armatimonadota bacterium]